MAEIIFRQVESGDIDHIASHLCAGERMTILDTHGPVTAIKDVVSMSVLKSSRCEVAVQAGKPLCVIGVVRTSFLESEGYLWMMATAEAFRSSRVLVREGRRYVSRLLDEYDRLIGRVDSRHEGIIKWLKLMGFTVGEPQPGQHGVLFCPYERRA